MWIAPIVRMSIRVSEIMERDVATAEPTWRLEDLERAFFEKRISGFPVVNHAGTLVGVVSRSDVVRILAFERSRAGEVSDYFRSHSTWQEIDDAETARSESQSVADRLKDTRVADLMSPPIHTVSADSDVQDAAALMHKNSIHRVPVVDRERLVGILSSLDIVGLVARRGEDNE